jgi:hypothetical protein
MIIIFMRRMVEDVKRGERRRTKSFLYHSPHTSNISWLYPTLNLVGTRQASGSIFV